MPKSGIETALLEEAQYAVSNLKNRARALEPQLQEINKLKLPKRLLKFQTKIGTEFQCPRCWIEHERRSSLRPVPAGTRDDMMKCSVCAAEYAVPDA